MKDVPMPPNRPLEHALLFHKPGFFKRGEDSDDDEEDDYNERKRGQINGEEIDLDKLKEWLGQEGRLCKADVLAIIDKATKIFAAEPTLLQLSTPITICGDLHGQYYDLMRLLTIGGSINSTTYLFLGDYVDRGCFGVEILLLLFSMKITYPEKLFMIRGNHECRHMTEYFSFRSECEHKYDADVYNAFLKSFKALPLGAVVNEQFLCVHGGISPEIKTLDDIKKINRFREPPSFGPMCDLLWADPAQDFVAEGGEHFGFNEVRGCSYMFTYQAASAFLERNSLLSIVRAHEVQDNGYSMLNVRESTGFPVVITIFSAPNYLDSYNNRGAVLHYNSSELNIRQFNNSPHPYWLPNFTNVFAWSLPFVSEKVAQMQLALLQMCDDSAEEEVEKEEEHLSEKDVLERRAAIQDKIRSVTRFMSMYQTLRNEAETVTRIKSLATDAALPKGALLGGRLALERILGDFGEAKKNDAPNERRPPMPTASTETEDEDVSSKAASTPESDQ